MSDERKECECLRCVKARTPLTEAGWPIESSRMFVCSICGNKRCPHSDWHGNPCTGSNEPGQPGSRYGGLPASPQGAQGQDAAPDASGTETPDLRMILGEYEEALQEATNEGGDETDTRLEKARAALMTELRKARSLARENEDKSAQIDFLHSTLEATPKNVREQIVSELDAAGLASIVSANGQTIRQIIRGYK